MLRFSANLSLLFTDLPLQDRFAAAKAAGFSAVEIQFPYSLDSRLLNDELQKNELSLVLINVAAGDLMQGGYGLAGIPGREQAFRREVFNTLSYVQDLDIRCINILAGRQPPDADLSQCLHTLSANARYAAEVFQSVGITTTLEAINTFDMPDFLISNPVHMEEILSVADHPTLKMQFDCYHMQRMGIDVISNLKHYCAHIGHIQIADVPGRGAPGTGTMPYGQIFDVIEQLPYNGWCGAEYLPGEAGTMASLKSWSHWRQS